MNFEYSEDQLAFRESVTKFLQQEYSFKDRQRIQKSDAAYSAHIWESCAELGWLSLPFAEEVGGFGGSAVDSILLFEELGKHLVTEPFIETMLQVGGILQACRHPQRLTYIEKLMAGELQGAFAHSEPYQAHFEQDLRTRAIKLDDGYQLRGSKSVVYNATAAEIFIISAELEGDKALFNQYAYLPVNPETHEHVKADAAKALKIAPEHDRAVVQQHPAADASGCALGADGAAVDVHHHVGRLRLLTFPFPPTREHAAQHPPDPGLPGHPGHGCYLCPDTAVRIPDLLYGPQYPHRSWLCLPGRGDGRQHLADEGVL